MIRQRGKFSFSEFFYAINPNSLRGLNHYSYGVDAVWFKRKNGIVSVCEGTLVHVTRKDNIVFDDMVRDFDGRYGGGTEYKWDGTEMWASDNNFLDMVEAHKRLDPILNDFPNIPKGYDGWFSIR